MANYANLKAAISQAIKTNGNQEITGQVLQDVLNSIVSVIGANYTFAGVATPATNPGTPDQNVVYLAMEGGTYTNFNAMVLSAGISLLMWNGTWTSETVMYGDGGVFDISVYKSSGGTLATFADLAAALDGGNNIPASARKGGMSVKYVSSSDNKYVQWRYMGTAVTGTPNPFLDTANWQGVDDEPVVGSQNLIKSGGVVNFVSIFVDNCPFIKELYINEVGVENNIDKLHSIIVTDTAFRVRFSNADGTAYTATTPTVQKTDAYTIIPIRKEGDATVTVGYIIVDWRTITSNIIITTNLNPIVYKVDYSPRIKEYLDNAETESALTSLDQRVTVVERKTENIEEGDRKNISGMGTAGSFPALLWLQKPEVVINKVTKIRFRAKTGSISFYKLTWDGFGTDATKELINIVENTSSEQGNIKEVSVNVSLNANQYIAVSGDIFYKSSGATLKGTRFDIDTGVCATSDWTIIDFAWEILNTDSVQYRIDEVEAEVTELSGRLTDDENRITALENNGEPYSRYDGKYATLLNEKLNSSKDYILTSTGVVATQTFGTFGLIVDNPLFINKFYSIQREATFLCKFAATTVARFECATAYDSSSNNSVFEVNIPNSTVKCKNLSVQNSEILFANHIIAVTIQKDYNNQILKIVNVTLGKEEVFKWTYDGNGRSDGTTVDTGMQHDYYRLNLASGSGSYEVAQLTILAPKAELVIYGDSITEGEAYYPSDKFDQHWVQLIVKKMKGRAVASGRSGTSTVAMMSRMPNELPYIRPKYVMVTIGTNGQASQQQITDVVDYIISVGSVPILNHIPANLKAGGVSTHVAVNQIIDAVRTAKNITGADLDIVTSLNGVPADGVNPAMMWHDGTEQDPVYLHPNVEGSMAMYQKILLDVPQIFD